MNKLRILIVDDYLPTRKLIADALGQVDKYEVVEAENGLIALDIFKKSPFDLVITDVMMPVLSGMDLLLALREIDPAVSVIMITAHTALDVTVSAIKKGAVDFLQKPFDIDDLLFKVDIYLRDKANGGREGIPGQPGQLPIIAGMKHDLSIQQHIYDLIEKTSGKNEEIFRNIVDLALKVVNGNASYLLLYDKDEDDFHVEVARTRSGEPPAAHKIMLWEGLFREVLKRPECLIRHREDHPDIPYSLICSPLMIRSTVFGILAVTKAPDYQLFNTQDLHYLQTITKRASLNIENKLLYESIYSNVIDTFQSLVTSIQARDHYTEQHSLRVADMSVKVARLIDCNPGDLEQLKIAAALHDIGKISVPDIVLLKPDGLSADEFEIMKNHSCLGESILQSITLLSHEKKIIRHHHERWDGRGYPDGISGKNIPLFARILAVADSFDAMVNERPYRQAMPLDQALLEIKNGRGSQFDPTVVDAFLSPDFRASIPF